MLVLSSKLAGPNTRIGSRPLPLDHSLVQSTMRSCLEHKHSDPYHSYWCVTQGGSPQHAATNFETKLGDFTPKRAKFFLKFSQIFSKKISKNSQKFEVF